MKPKFIVIEGPDGTGKTTLINNLKNYFIENEIEAIFTREPGGTNIGEKIRTIILDQNNIEMTDMTEAYLYTASRIQHIEELILPKLKENKLVICDRFILASLCYQGYGRQKDVERIKKINQPVLDLLNEDLLYFVLMAEPKIGLNRKKKQKCLDRIESESVEFHNRVYNGYKALLSENEYIEIDASKSQDEMLTELLYHLKNLDIL